MTAWRHALDELVESTEANLLRSLRAVRIVTSTASLHARHLDEHLACAEILIPLVAERTPPGSFERDVPARAIVLRGLACFNITLTHGTETDVEASLGDLLDTASLAL